MKKLRWILLGIVVVIAVAAVTIGVIIYNRFNKKVEKLAQVDGNLAFISDKDTNWHIFILDKDGTTLRDVTGTAADSKGDDFIFNFTFASDMIYFYSNRSGAFNPARIKPDGSGLELLNFMTAGLKVITDKHFDVGPQWSPDGTQLAWSKTHMSGFTPIQDVCLAPVTDPNNFKCVTDKKGNNTEIAWSPDGKKLVYASDRGEKYQDVYVVDVASGQETKLTTSEPASAWAFQPVWSLDGQSILFIWNLQDDSLTKGKLDLYVVKAAGGEEPHQLAAGETFKGGAAYSPSGKLVAYMSNETGKWAIYLMNKDGSGVHRVTEGDFNYMFPSWVPTLASATTPQ